ncbi:protein starmaker-like isoform X2 [Oreochromis niloticus]|uniref:protein starmaker-like isoform X2 n=1 Tax=Oreochromis niloticus TaxID=8128 RepID=UPI0009047FF3|nr:protein starmaker-like isoform X2 [Oreochromis niloticus]
MTQHKDRRSSKSRHSVWTTVFFHSVIILQLTQINAEADIEITEVSPGVLECKSKGWYPEPEVFWLESEGKIIPAGSKEILRGPDDLYVLSSRLTLEKGHSNNITCRIQQNNQYREAKIHAPDALSARSTIAGLIAGVVFIIFVAFLVWKWRKYNMETKKCSNDGESQRRSMNKTHPSVIESDKAPLLKQDKVEVNDTAHVSTEPESSCQNEGEKEYDIANKNIPQTRKSGTQKNNNQPGRETANDLYRNDEAQSGNGRQAQPEQFENNTESRKDEIPNQSLMDDSGQEHQPKQGQEAKNDTSTEENKNKTQTINDETAPQSASAEEGKQSTHSEGKEMKCQHSNSGVNVYINGEKNTPTSQESGTNQNQSGSDVAANASETPAKKPDSEESQLEKPTIMSEGQKEEAGGKIISPAFNNKHGNRYNETQDLPDENKTLPSHSGANETNQDQLDSNTQEKQSGNNPTTDQILTGVDHQQQQQPREGQETKRDSEKHVKDGNGDETQTTNNKTADSNNKDTSQNDPSEGKEPKDDKEKVCKSKNKAQPLDPEVITTNQEQSGSEPQLNTEEKQSGNTQTTDESPIEGGQQEEQLRKSSDAKSVPEDEKKDSNGDETQTTNNKTADSADKDISQGGNPKENTEKDSNSKAGAQPSDPEVSTTNQKKPGKGLTSVEKNQSVKSTTEDQSEQQELSTEEEELENDAEEAQDTEVD